MRLKRGVDDRLLAIFLAACCVVGCIAQPGGKTPAKPKQTATGIAELSRLAQLELLAASADAIDGVADRVASGELKYDSGLQSELQTAFNAGQDGEASKKLSIAMKAAMDPDKDTFDLVKVEKALRAVASGRRALK